MEILGYPLHAGLSGNSGIEARTEVKVTPKPIAGRSPAAMKIKRTAVEKPRNPPTDIAEEESKR